jgi:hypothetical protein
MRRLGTFLLLAILLVLPETVPLRVFAQSGELPTAAPKEAFRASGSPRSTSR